MSNKIQLYPHQKELVDSLITSISSSKTTRPVAVGVTSFGKSLCIAELVERIHKYKDQRILILVPNKELVEQNESEIKMYNPNRKVYVHSASVNRKELGETLIATIGSVKKKAAILKPTVVIIDECDMLSSKETSMYQTFIASCSERTRFLGLTGTPFRLKEGYIYEGDDSFFNCCVYDSSQTSVFNKLVEEGYLARIKTKQSKGVLLDSTGIKTIAGDFSLADLSENFDKEEITKEIVADIVTYKDRYKSMLLYGIDIAHVENINRLLNEAGIKSKAFHSQMKENRDAVLTEFREGKLQALVNCEVLTRGFSHKKLDFIALLRNTKSQALFRQIVGRLLRTHPDKPHGLFLDYTDTSYRLGAINVPVDFTKKKKGKGGTMSKVCQECGEVLHISVKVCPDCGYVFPEKPKLNTVASTVEIVKETIIETHDVTGIKYDRHIKKGSPDSMRVTYDCGLRSFFEWVAIDHDGYPRMKALQWIVNRGGKSLTLEELLSECKTYPVPKAITVDETEKYPRVLNYVF